MLLLIAVCLVSFFLLRWLRPAHPLVLNVYFGVPGSGKTTFAAYLVKWANSCAWPVRLALRWPDSFWGHWVLDDGGPLKSFWKRPITVYSNVPITGAYEIDARKDIGVYMVQNGKLIIDEAGVEFNNRNFKSFPQEAIYFFKYHRHYRVSVDVFSQSFEDMDVTIRRLARSFFVVRKSLIPGCIVVKKIRRKVGIDEQTHQIIDAYSFGLPVLDTKWVWCPPLWRLFNTFSCRPLPVKYFSRW